MGQRNMLYTVPTLDMETEHGHLHPEPCVVPYGAMTSFPQPTNGHATLQPPGNRTNFNCQHPPENHGPLPYGITQYNAIDHHHPANGIEPNNTFMTPSPTARVFPVAINHRLHDQLPFSSNHGSFERNNSQFMDGFNSAFKRKNPEGFPGNFQYFYPAPGSSSSVAIPMSSDAASFSIPEYGGNNDIPGVMEAGPHRSVRNRGAGAIGVDPVLAHNGGHLIPGNYGGHGQPLQAVPTPWLDQQFCGNGSDAAPFSWNHAPGMPYIQGCLNGGGMEAANTGPHGYQVTASSRNSGAFVRPPPIPPHQVPHNLHHPQPPPMPPLRGHNMDFHPQQASTSRRLSTNNSTSYTGVNPFLNGVELVPRFMGPTPPTGLRVYRPQRRELMIDSTARHRSFPHLRVLPEDGVAILDISGYHEVGHSIDHHRDMRLDIDHMSYEELLALGEQIGSVGSGLSDDFILNHLKTRTFALSKSSHSEDALSIDQELNFCVICQMDYNDQETIGVVDCGHKYHVDCIKKWLIVKNTCPVCKSTALSSQSKQEEESPKM